MRLFRSLLGIVSLALLAAACASDLPTSPSSADLAKGGGKPAPSTPARHPILFVHGYNSSGSTWNTMVGNFKRDGWKDAELHAWTYNYRLSNVDIAAQLDAKVNEILTSTGATKVDIISHSMGGLSSRYYAKNLGGDMKIDAWVSLGGPNHGTTWGNWCFDVSCVEMRPGSTFLADLNSGDETPGTPRYATWRSPCDEIINPRESVILDGATNTQTACVTHSALKEDRTIYGQVRDWVHSGS